MNTLSSHQIRPKALEREKTCASCPHLSKLNTCFKYPYLLSDEFDNVPYALIPHPTYTAKCKKMNEELRK